MSSDADKQQRGSDGGSGDGAERQRLDGELGRFEPVSDGLVLAAVERAERHREREREGVMLSDIAEHQLPRQARSVRAARRPERETCSERHGRARVQPRANCRGRMEQGLHKRGARDRGQRPGTPAAKPASSGTRGLEIRRRF